jgi:hypothetical protein
MSTALRSRVEHLLHGNSEMREESKGNGLVSEIAHFLAHPIVRNKGIAWREVSDLFAFLKFREPLSRRRIVTVDFPASMPDALRANLRRMRRLILRRDTGLNRAEADQMLDNFSPLDTYSRRRAGRYVKPARSEGFSLRDKQR